MAKRIPAGEMRHTITILQHKLEYSSTALDDYGQVSASSTALATMAGPMRAKLEQLTGEERVIARQIYPSATHRATIDYNSTLDSTGGSRRVVEFGSRLLYIGGVINPDLENVQLQLLCGEER